MVHSAQAVGYTLSCQTPPHRRTFSRVPAPKKPDDRQFKVGDKIGVNLHHGKIEDAIVRAVVRLAAAEGIKLQVDFGHEQTALVEEWQVVE